MKAAIKKTYGKKGDDILNMNYAAVDQGATGVVRKLRFLLNGLTLLIETVTMLRMTILNLLRKSLRPSSTHARATSFL